MFFLAPLPCCMLPRLETRCFLPFIIPLQRDELASTLSDSPIAPEIHNLIQVLVPSAALHQWNCLFFRRSGCGHPHRVCMILATSWWPRGGVARYLFR